MDGGHAYESSDGFDSDDEIPLSYLGPDLDQTFPQIQSQDNNLDLQPVLRTDRDFQQDTSDPNISMDSTESDEESTVGLHQPRWKLELSAKVKQEFSGPKPGPTVVLGQEKNELDFLDLFFPEELYDMIACETNKYTALKYKTTDNPVTANEIAAYFGM